MRESGLVMEIKEQTMVVEFARSSMCEKCGACERAQEAMRMEVRRAQGARIGDEVLVQLPEKTLLRAALLAYGLPLLLLLAGLLVGYRLPGLLQLPGNPDFYALGLGAICALITFAIIRLTEPRRKRAGQYAPQVVEVKRLCQLNKGGKSDG